MKGVEGMTVYVFFRRDIFTGEEFFYPIELSNDDDAKRSAEINFGTIRVEDIDGNIIWSQPNGTVYKPMEEEDLT